MVPETIKIYSGHDNGFHTMDVPKAMKAGLEDVIAGKSMENDIPRPARFKMTNSDRKPTMHFVGNIKVVYDANIIKPLAAR